MAGWPNSQIILGVLASCIPPMKNLIIPPKHLIVFHFLFLPTKSEVQGREARDRAAREARDRQKKKNRKNRKNSARACLNGPILGRNIFFECNDLHYLVDIIAVYHNMQNQRNLMIQTRENGRKPQIWANLGPFCPNLGQEIFFSKIGLRHFF